MNDEQRTTDGVCLGPMPDGSALLLLGFSKGARKYMSKGKTHHVDLQKAGIGFPFKVMAFGADSYQECMDIVQKHNQNIGVATVETPGQDYGIDGADHEEAIAEAKEKGQPSIDSDGGEWIPGLPDENGPYEIYMDVEKTAWHRLKS